MIEVRQALAEEFITASRGMPLCDIMFCFRKHKFHTLPVVDEDGKLLGQITLSDITEVFKPHPRGINQLLETVPFLNDVPEAELSIDNITPDIGRLIVASEIMSTDYKTISPDARLSEAYEKMTKEKRHVLTVVEEDGTFVGVLGLFDIIYALFQEKGIVC